MSTTLIEIRRAKPPDAAGVAATHDEAWRSAYQGIIPGTELDKLINRRGPDWWESAIRKGSRIALLVFGETVAGYANYGRNRARSLFYDGEIYELYLRPQYQGLGFGRRLFTAARRDLAQSGMKSLVIWALSDNEPAIEFYRALGGKAVARSSERFGNRTLEKMALGWTPEAGRTEIATARSPHTLGGGRPANAQAARTVLTSRQAIVIGPTPPGTGVMAPATAQASAYATSPTSRVLPPSAGTRLIPTSITVAPGLIQSALIISGRPTAANSRSARRAIAASRACVNARW